MDDLLELLERYEPGYRDQISGYPDFILDELEEVFGRPLPPAYREFAQAMGVKGGPLLSKVEAYDPILNVALLYRTASGGMPPRRFLYVFGDSDSLVSYHYWLDLEAPSETGDCQVVRMPFGNEALKNLSRDFISLREMLFVWAMENLRLPALPHQANYHCAEGAQPSEVGNLTRLFERMGFVRLAYPQHCLLFERDDGAIRLYRAPGSPNFLFRVGLREPGELRRFQLLIEDNTRMLKL